MKLNAEDAIERKCPFGRGEGAARPCRHEGIVAQGCVWAGVCENTNHTDGCNATKHWLFVLHQVDLEARRYWSNG